MIKKYCIFFFLASAYALLSAHNFTPHQHADTRAEASPETSKETSHGHDHEHNHANDHGEGEENSGANPFHYFQHTAGPVIEFNFTQYTTQLGAKEVNLQRFLPTTGSGETYRKEQPPPRPPDYTVCFLSQQSTHYFILLKAPPSPVIA